MKVSRWTVSHNGIFRRNTWNTFYSLAYTEQNKTQINCSSINKALWMKKKRKINSPNDFISHLLAGEYIHKPQINLKFIENDRFTFGCAVNELSVESWCTRPEFICSRDWPQTRQQRSRSEKWYAVEPKMKRNRSRKMVISKLIACNRRTVLHRCCPCQQLWVVVIIIITIIVVVVSHELRV